MIATTTTIIIIIIIIAVVVVETMQVMLGHLCISASLQTEEGWTIGSGETETETETGRGRGRGRGKGKGRETGKGKGKGTGRETETGERVTETGKETVKETARETETGRETEGGRTICCPRAKLPAATSTPKADAPRRTANSSTEHYARCDVSWKNIKHGVFEKERYKNKTSKL